MLGKAALIGRCLRRIHTEYQGHEHELTTNYTRQDAILLDQQRVCEASIDAAMHLVRIHHLDLPTDSCQAFQMIAQAGLIDAELARRLQTMVGFRNIAVHAYQEFDMDTVRGILEHRLTDLEALARCLVALGLADNPRPLNPQR
ncbi:MAG: type VII toxin-antitoxin system HepT family RNase toxin [Thiobacillaceae bacterium]